MKRMCPAFRALAAMTAIASSLVGLTACGGGGFSQANSSEQISFMLLGATKQTTDYLVNRVIPDFKEETGTDVKIQSSDWGSAFQKITTAAASKQMADVVVLGSIWTAPLASRNALLPLDDYLNDFGDKGLIFPSMMLDGQWEGIQYSIPFGTDLRVPIYRKDLLEQAGVDSGSLPTTWEELEQVAEKIRDAKVCDSPIWWGIDKSIGLQQNLALLMFQNDVEYWTAGKANFASPASKEAIGFLVESFKKQYSNYNLVYSGNGPRPLISGQAAISFAGIAEFSNADENDPSVKNKLVVGPAIMGPSAESGAIGAWTNKLAISKDSQNPDSAFNFIKFLLRKDVLSRFDQLYGQLPVRTDMMEEDWMEESGKDLMKLADTAKSQDPHPGMMQFGNEINRILESAIRQTMTIDQTAEAINQELDSWTAE